MAMVQLITATEAETQPIRKIPLADIIGQHRARWVVHTGIGDILLRRIRHLELEKITLDLMAEVPNYVKVITEAAQLSDMAKFENGLDETQMLRFIELGTWLEPYQLRYQIPCIIEPSISKVEELDALYEALTDAEYQQVFALLGQLGNPNLSEKVSLAGIGIATEFNIPISPDLNIENMTAQQAAVFGQATDERNKAVKSMIQVEK